MCDRGVGVINNSVPGGPVRKVVGCVGGRGQGECRGGRMAAASLRGGLGRGVLLDLGLLVPRVWLRGFGACRLARFFLGLAGITLFFEFLSPASFQLEILVVTIVVVVIIVNT